MNRIRVVIVDKDFENHIKLIFLKGLKEIEICGFTDILLRGIEILSKENPDILFLGIELNEGCGFDLLNKFDGYKFHVIFLINKNDVLERTFSYSGIDYLVKPIEIKQLKTILKKLFDKKLKNGNPRQHNDNHKKKNIILNNLVLQDSNGISMVDISQIISCEVHNNCVILNMVNKSQYAVTIPLCSIEVLLNQSNTIFYRIHNNTIISLQYLNRFETKKKSYVLMKNGVKYNVAHRRKKGLKDLLTQQVKT
jgi:two-component system, LytTR family, response regulator